MLAADGAVQVVTTGSVGKPLGEDPSGFRVVRLSGGGKVEHEYVTLAVEAGAVESGK